MNFLKTTEQAGLSATQRLAANPEAFVKPVAAMLNNYDKVSAAPAANLSRAPKIAQPAPAA